MPQFDPSSFASQIFWLIVSFGVLYYLMARVALPRIAEVLEERSERIANDLEKAQALRKESEAVVAAYEDALAKARADAGAVIAATKAELADLTAAREKDFADKVAQKTAESEARIAAVRAEMTEQVKAIATATAGDITRQIAGLDVANDAVSTAVAERVKETAA